MVEAALLESIPTGARMKEQGCSGVGTRGNGVPTSFFDVGMRSDTSVA